MAHDLWKKIGNVPTLEQALELVLANRTRYGRKVTTQSVKLEAEKSEANRRVLQEALSRLDNRLSRNKKSNRAQKKKQIQLKMQREILTAMHAHGDRQIHASELAAAMVLVNGVNEQKLRPLFNAARNMEKSGPTFSGTFSEYVKALSRNALKRIHEMLKRNSPNPISAVSIWEALSISKKAFHAASPILDLAGAAHKLPVDASTNANMWMHASARPPIPEWNVHYRILRALAERGGPTTLSAALTEAGKRRRAQELETRGLIRVVGQKSGGPLYCIEPDTLRWVSQTEATAKLHPDLWRALLGAIEDKPPISPHRDRQIRRELAFRMALQTSTDGPFKIGRQLGFNSRMIQLLLQGATTLRQFKPKGLRAIADYYAGIGLKKEAEYLRVVAGLAKDEKTPL